MTVLLGQIDHSQGQIDRSQNGRSGQNDRAIVQNDRSMLDRNHCSLTYDQGQTVLEGQNGRSLGGN